MASGQPHHSDERDAVSCEALTAVFALLGKRWSGVIIGTLLARLDLRPVDRATAELATALSSRYRLKAVDAAHLATAVGLGADRFITNNQRDFPATITEVQVTYPADLPGTAGR